MAEIELSVFSSQCLDRRIGEEATLKGEIAALEAERNQAKATIAWRFSTQDAQVKLQHVYPPISN
jgi:hypothetical protein